MELDNNVALRPRFHKDVDLSICEIIERATKVKQEVIDDIELRFQIIIYFYLSLMRNDAIIHLICIWN